MGQDPELSKAVTAPYLAGLGANRVRWLNLHVDGYETSVKSQHGMACHDIDCSLTSWSYAEQA